MVCDKLGDTLQARSTYDVGSLKYCIYFLDYPVAMTMTEVPTKRLAFKCSRQSEDQRPRRVLIVFMMAQRAFDFAHQPSAPRACFVMNAKDIICNDIIQYLNDNGVGFLVDVTPSRLGNEFIKHLTSAPFSLSHKVWQALHDTHNIRGGAAPSPEFSVFFGRKVIGHEADKLDVMYVVQHVQDMWIGMGNVLTNGIRHAVLAKIKHLITIIQKYF